MAARLAQTQLQTAYTLTSTLLHWPNLHGVSATCTIISHYKRRGDYRVHIGVTSALNAATPTQTLCFTFGKGYRERHEEDAAVSNLALEALCEAAGVGTVDMGVGVFTEAYEAVNAVGESTGTDLREVVPRLVPYAEDTAASSWFVDVDMGGDVIETMAAPTSKLPANAIVIFPSTCGDCAENYTAVLAALDLARDGPIGKSWTTHQPPTLFVGAHPGVGGRGFLTPNSEESCAVENWGVLRNDVDGTSGQTVVHKYRASGATFVMPSDEFFALNPRVVRECVRAGSRFVVDCEKVKGLERGMQWLMARCDSTEGFFEIANAMVLLNTAHEKRQSGFDDGSPSTVGVESLLKGDEEEGGYVVCEWENGITYRGWMNEGKFHGEGTKLYSKGGGYVGVWAQGKREGMGLSVYGGKFGFEQWEGGFINDKPEGRGVMTKTSGEQIVFGFKDGEPVDK